MARDTSFYGATAPVYGARSRFEFGWTIGTVNYTSVLADWRRYYMPVRPFTLAIRGLHYGRYGRDSEHNQLIDMYAGYPEFVHGYGVGSFSGERVSDRVGGRRVRGVPQPAGQPDARRESRGARADSRHYAEIEDGRFPIDLAFFADAGLTWRSDDRPEFAGGTRRPVRSVGAAFRTNLFGLIALEISASRPFDRADNQVRWQIGIRQGF